MEENEKSELMKFQKFFSEEEEMSEEFSYKMIVKNAVAVINFQGKMTKEAKETLTKCQKELVESASKNVIFIFKEVPSVDHIVFRELTFLQTEARKNGLSVYIVGLSSSLKQYLTERGVIRTTEIKPSLEDTLRTI